MNKAYTIQIPADWNKNINPADKLELHLCVDEDGKDEAILSFPDGAEDYLAQALLDINKAKLIVSLLRSHFDF